MDSERVYEKALSRAEGYALQAESSLHEPVEVREKWVGLAKMWALVATAAAQDPGIYEVPTFDGVDSPRIESVKSDLL